MFQQITVDTSTVKSLDMTIPGHSYNTAVISVEDADIRLRLDGQDPTTTIGVKIPKDSVIRLTDRNELKNARFLCASGTAILNVQFRA